MDKVGLSGKYQTYPEYKDSGVEWIGEIPTDWDMWKITHACPYVASGTTPKSDGSNYYDGTNLWVTTGELREGVILDTTKKVTDKALYDLPTLRIHPKGSVVIAMYGATIGRLGILGNNATTNQACCVMPPSDIINNKYLFYWLYSTRQEIINLSSGGGQPNVNQEKISSLKVSAPTYKYQVEIANFLDHETAKIDTLIDKQQQLIKLLKEKRQAVISHAVTKGLNSNAPMRDSGVEWLGEVPAHWIKKIKLLNLSESNRGSFVNGPFGSDLLADELRDEGVPVVYIRDIKRLGYKRKSTVCVTPAKAEQLNVCKVTSGDVIISKVGDPPGDACIYPEGEADAIITQDVIRIRVDRSVVNPEYLVMLLNSDFGQMVMNDISVEGTRKRVSLGDFKATKFVIPSLNDQDNIVDYVHKQCKNMDTLISKSENAVRLIRERRTALISAAVTGKIDVRDWVAPEPSNNKIDASLYGNGVDLNKEASL